MNQPRLLVIMDPISAIKPYKDSTFAILLTAQAKGWSNYYAELQDIWLLDGKAMGCLARVQVMDDTENWFKLEAQSVIPLEEMDVIIMRKDPPFDIEYIMATYVLERAEDRGVVVVNRPQGLRDANEKAFGAWFPNCVPPTMISRSLKEMRHFIDGHQKVVVKPMDLMGGQSVFVTDIHDGNLNVILESVSHGGTRYTMVQKYLPEITTSGDKRILLIDGDPIPFALHRIPSGGDHRGNLVNGAIAEVHPLTEHDFWICKQISPEIRRRGLLFVGIDVIGEFLTELNVTSPTGIREIERASDVHISELLLNVITTKLG